VKITVHYLNGSTYTLKGGEYWWTTYQGEFYQYNQKEFLDIYRGRERVHAENLADVLAVEQVYEDGRIILSPFKKCCVIKTGVYTKESWDWFCNGLHKLRWSNA